MKIISAIGSFKGSIDSEKINAIVKDFFEKRGITAQAIPVADGGDGLLTAVCTSIGAVYENVNTVNALGEPISARVGISGDVGIVEMALADGLAILPENRYDPLKTSTYGTGLLIKHLALSGIENIILGIGGSATNDGGMGCLYALGYEFFDKKGNAIKPCGENLCKVYSVSDKNVSPQIKALNIQIACDVTNPLLGEKGATYVYCPQKGGNEITLPLLEKGMEIYSKAVANFCGTDYSRVAGAGAAGGLGFGLKAILGAKLMKGAEIVLEYAKYKEKLTDADLVITGEGRIDNQTVFGKLPQIVAKTAESMGVPCVAVVGSSTADAESLSLMGIKNVYELVNYAPLDRCMNNTEKVVETVLEALLEDIK